MTVRNQALQLERSLESILAQSFPNFAIVAVDDDSEDDSFSILERYESQDARLHIFRNEERLGYVRNACRVHQLCTELFPSAEFFAWASDHDVWHPNWLRLLLTALAAAPDASLAYSWHHVIANNGELVHARALRFDQDGQRNLRERMLFAVKQVPAGSLIYGLIRNSALQKTSGLRLVLAPDSLLIAELALAGRLVCVPEFLWHRRYYGLFSLARQRLNIFPEGAPLYTYLPIVIQHASTFFYDLTIRRVAPNISPWRGCRLACDLIAARLSNEQRRTKRQQALAKTSEMSPRERRLKRFRNIAMKKGTRTALALEVRHWLSSLRQSD
jgi:glycosyltransferase involved in cell wall biosynthesis